MGGIQSLPSVKAEAARGIFIFRAYIYIYIIIVMAENAIFGNMGISEDLDLVAVLSFMLLLLSLQ